MKITIDTKEDSPEDIRKVISLLSNLIENSNSIQQDDNIAQQEEQKNSNDAFANLFNDPVPQKEEKEEQDNEQIEIVPY